MLHLHSFSFLGYVSPSWHRWKAWMVLKKGDGAHSREKEKGGQVQPGGETLDPGPLCKQPEKKMAMSSKFSSPSFSLLQPPGNPGDSLETHRHWRTLGQTLPQASPSRLPQPARSVEVRASLTWPVLNSSLAPTPFPCCQAALPADLLSAGRK